MGQGGPWYLAFGERTRGWTDSPPSEPQPGSAGEGFAGTVQVVAGLSGLMALFEAFTLVLLWTNGLWD